MKYFALGQEENGKTRRKKNFFKQKKYLKRQLNQTEDKKPEVDKINLTQELSGIQTDIQTDIQNQSDQQLR